MTPVTAPFLFGNHLIALLAIHAQPTIRIRELSVLLGLTERSAQRVIGDLENAGVILTSRDGRRNRYTIVSRVPIELPDGRRLSVGEVLRALTGSEPSE